MASERMAGINDCLASDNGIRKDGRTKRTLVQSNDVQKEGSWGGEIVDFSYECLIGIFGVGLRLLETKKKKKKKERNGIPIIL